MTKKLLLCLALLCGFAFGQVDIPIGTVGPVRTIVSGATWTGGGVGSVNNSYIMTPAYTFETACVYIVNNDTSSHTAVFQFYTSGDQNITKYQGNTGSWQNTGPNVSTPLIVTVPASSIYTIGSQISNAARVAFVVGAGSGSGTVNLAMVESPSLSGCGNLPSVSPVSCESSATGSLASGTQVNFTGQQQQAYYVCNITISAAGAFAAGNWTVIEGTGAACGTGTATVWEVLVQTTTTSPQQFIAQPLIGRFSGNLDNAGNGFCFQNNQATTIQYYITFARF